MDKKDFLFELGVEEIPAAYIAGAIKTIKDHFESNLKKANLDYNELQIFSTPRRFAIKILSLQTQQKDEIIERTGLTKEMAYDIDGNLTNAALGFLRGAGAEQKDIIIKQTPKGDKIAIRKEIEGKSATLILKDLTMDSVAEIQFQKSMKWGSSKLSFARPIRWILVLFGNDIIDLEFEGIKSGNITYGNRFQNLENLVEINSIDEYEEKLLGVFVIPNREERKKIIIKQMNDLFLNSNEKVIENIKLLETVTDLVEYPTAVIADFNKKYIELPKLVITSTLSEHQKYFSISKLDGKLSNKFLFISNGDPQYSNLIKQGNEKVITARLEDAEFFYKEDTAQPFDTFVPKLAEVTFQQKLSSVLEKTERINHLWSKPRSPKTNGYVERFNWTIQDEFINYEIDSVTYNPKLFDKKLRNWLIFYNNKRPHQSLEYKTPNQVLLQLQSNSKKYSKSSVSLYTNLLSTPRFSI